MNSAQKETPLLVSGESERVMTFWKTAPLLYNELVIGDGELLVFR